MVLPSVKKRMSKQVTVRKWLLKQKIKPKYLRLIVEGAKETKMYNLPVGSHIVLEEGEEVKQGQVLVKIPRVLGKLRDITGGLPRVTELFEARNPSNPAVVSEIDGVVSFGNIKRGNREIIVEARDGVVKKYLGSIYPPDSCTGW